MIDGGRSVTEVARELRVHESLLGKWVRAERLREGAVAAARGVPPDEGLAEHERAELTRLRAEVAEKDGDIAFLKKSLGVLCGTATPVSRYELVAAECADHDISILTALLGVSRSGYDAWAARRRRGEVSPRRQRRRDLEVKILAHWQASRRTYGSPRITADLHAEGERVSANTVAEIMAEMGIEGISPRTFKVRTTVVDPTASFPPDRVGRSFDRGRLDAVWTSDITYLTCGEGDAYWCAIRDEHSRRVLGWSLAEHMRTELVTAAVEAAVTVRGGSVTGTILHSDRGSRYTSHDMAKACSGHGLRRSMGATGICWDNAGAESLWSTVEHEYYKRHAFTTYASLLAGLGKYIRFYNNDRRHSSLGMVSPIDFEITSRTSRQSS
nr:IS3 family transposase [Skermania piniformis]